MPASVLLLGSCLPEEEPKRTCDDVTTDFESERAAIQQCEEDADCGLVLEGTSCGCTRDWIARNDADTHTFYALLDEASDRECDLALTSTCDCPAVAGFLCAEGTCAWNYVDAYPYLPVCHTSDGDSFTADSVAIEGDELVVSLGYSGGCEEHDFTLCWPDQTFMESHPVQASLELFHDAHHDTCEAWITEERRFSLVPLRAAYAASYGTKVGTIVIHVAGSTVSWTF
jgi:hypothetical protein